MMRNKLPSQKHLNELLRYDESTGKLFWNVRAEKHFQSAGHCVRWNGIWANREAFTAISSGRHKQGWLQCEHYLAHRLIYKMVKGEEPASIDHINGIYTDNRMENLRAVTHQDNCRNSKRRKDNTSGTTGVYYCENSWRAYISFGGKKKMLGSFQSRALAVAARKAAEIKHEYHANHGRVMAA